MTLHPKIHHGWFVLMLAANCFAESLPPPPPGYVSPVLSPKDAATPKNLTMVRSALVVVPPIGTNLALFPPRLVTNNLVLLSWTNGTSPFQVQERPTITANWLNVGNQTTNRWLLVGRTNLQRFFRVHTVAPSTAWAVPFVGSGSVQCIATAVDSGGNIFTTGYFNGSLSNLTSSGNNDVFLAKLNASGSVQWLKKISFGSGNETPSGLALAGGNVVVVGSFQGTGNFGGTNHISIGQSDCFVLKLDASGNRLWDFTLGGAQDDQLASVAADAAGNIAVAGWFQGQLTGPFKLNSDVASIDILVAVFNSAGEFQWLNPWAFYVAENDTYYNIDHAGSQWGRSVDFDANGNLFLGGYYQSPPDFGQGQLTPDTVGASFVCKIDDEGWLDYSVGMGTNNPARAFAMTVDGSGDPVITGDFSTRSDLGGGTLTNLGSTGVAGFVAKYSGVNGAHVWSRIIAGDYVVSPKSLTADTTNNVLFGGSFQRTYSFGTNTVTTLPRINSDGVLARYSPTGTVLSVQQYGGIESDGIQCVALDPSGKPVLAGLFGGTVTINGSTFTSTNGTGGFVAKQ